MCRHDQPSHLFRNPPPQRFTNERQSTSKHKHLGVGKVDDVGERESEAVGRLLPDSPSHDVTIANCRPKNTGPTLATFCGKTGK
jgi:hypothetical protein